MSPESHNYTTFYCQPIGVLVYLLLVQSVDVAAGPSGEAQRREIIVQIDQSASVYLDDAMATNVFITGE
jgi:hypothetical protein